MKILQIIKAIFGSILVFASSVALADSYVGISVGQFDSKAESLETDFDKSTSYVLSAGKRLNEQLAIELSYFDSGKGGDDDDPEWDIYADGFSFHAIGFINSSLYAKLGVTSYDVTLDINDAPCCGITGNNEESETDLSYGVGALFDITEGLSLKLDISAINTDGSDPTNVSLGLQFNL